MHVIQKGPHPASATSCLTSIDSHVSDTHQQLLLLHAGDEIVKAPKLFEKPSTDAEEPGASPQGFSETAAQPPVLISTPQQSESDSAAAHASLKEDAETNEALSAVASEPAAEPAELPQAAESEQLAAQGSESTQDDPAETAQISNSEQQMPDESPQVSSDQEAAPESAQSSDSEQRASEAAELRRQMAELRQAMADKAVAMQAAQAKTAQSTQPEASTQLQQSLPQPDVQSQAGPELRQQTDALPQLQQQSQQTEAQPAAQPQLQSVAQSNTQQVQPQSSQKAQSMPQKEYELIPQSVPESQLGTQSQQRQSDTQSELPSQPQSAADTAQSQLPASPQADSDVTPTSKDSPSTDRPERPQPSSAQEGADDSDATASGSNADTRSTAGTSQGASRQPFQVLPRPPSSSSSATIFIEPAPAEVDSHPVSPDRTGTSDIDDTAEDLVAVAAGAMAPHPDKAETGGTHLSFIQLYSPIISSTNSVNMIALESPQHSACICCFTARLHLSEL